MQRRRYEILLPLTFNDGTEVPEALVQRTKKELLDRFGGVSVLPGPVEGVWIHAGVRYEDKSVKAVVDVEDTPENRPFFVQWKPTLRERFRQIEICVTSTLVDVI